jgi:hypothetical protein
LGGTLSGSTSVDVLANAFLNVVGVGSLNAGTTLGNAGTVNFSTLAQTLEVLNGAGLLNLDSTVLTLNSGL